MSPKCISTLGFSMAIARNQPSYELMKSYWICWDTSTLDEYSLSVFKWCTKYDVTNWPCGPKYVFLENHIWSWTVSATYCLGDCLILPSFNVCYWNEADIQNCQCFVTIPALCISMANFDLSLRKNKTFKIYDWSVMLMALITKL